MRRAAVVGQSTSENGGHCFSGFGRRIDTGGGQRGTLDTLAAELALLRPDAIVAPGHSCYFRREASDHEIPIVMAPVDDPVRAGIVSSLAHPGGNITGVSLHGAELSRKRVEFTGELDIEKDFDSMVGTCSHLTVQLGWRRLEQRRLEQRRLGWRRWRRRIKSRPCPSGVSARENFRGLAADST